jgi:amide synthase
MFDVSAYVNKLGYSGGLEPTLETLRRLHKLHLMAIPFDNALNAERGLRIWEGVGIDVDAVFDEIVLGGRGGVCYELNGLFRELLRRLGFEPFVLSAGVRGPDGSFGPELEHLFSGMLLDGDLWLVDVGYSGPSYLEPLCVGPQVQEQYGCAYRFVEDEGFHVLERRPRDGSWLPVYRFRTAPRDLAEWSADSPDLLLYAKMLAAEPILIRGRAFEDGQCTLTGRRELTVRDGRENMRVLIRSVDLDEAVKAVLLH